jgi:hypothetical protein
MPVKDGPRASSPVLRRSERFRSNCLTAKDAKDSAKVAKEPRFREAFRQFDDLQWLGFPDAITNF